MSPEFCSILSGPCWCISEEATDHNSNGHPTGERHHSEKGVPGKNWARIHRCWGGRNKGRLQVTSGQASYHLSKISLLSDTKGSSPTFKVQKEVPRARLASWQVLASSLVFYWFTVAAVLASWGSASTCQLHCSSPCGELFGLFAWQQSGHTLSCGASSPLEWPSLSSLRKAC